MAACLRVAASAKAGITDTNSLCLAWGKTNQISISIYIFYDEPQKAEGIDSGNGTIARINPVTNEIAGFTILNPMQKTINSLNLWKQPDSFTIQGIAVLINEPYFSRLKQGVNYYARNE